MNTESYQYYLEKAKKLQPKFTLDANIEPVFTKLVQYFTKDIAFEEDGKYSLNKGLFLLGPTGTGKTFLLNTFKFSKSKHVPNHEDQAYKLESCIEIACKYASKGIDHIQIYWKGQSYAFDDLGAEETSINYMGARLNVLETIISMRYSNQCGQENPAFRGTHFTSNMTPVDIERLYGPRIRSRLSEMCNLITVMGDDRRK